jgi:hypothetical protein
MQSGVDMQIESDPICSSAGCDQYKQPAGPPQHPMDYFVPNFGMDKDVIATETNEKVASALVGHAWSFKTPESWEKYRNHAKDAEYNYDPALSEDMVTSQNSAAIATSQYGPNYKWGLEPDAPALLQLQSDPICSSAGCTQYKQPEGPAPHPMDYFVPNFGLDKKDVLWTAENERIASALVGHAWSFKTPESWEKWRNRAKDAEYNFHPELSEDMRTSLANQAFAEDSVKKTGYDVQDLVVPEKAE